MVYKVFGKKSTGSGLKNEILSKVNNLQISFINQSCENFKKEKFIHHLKIIFRV